MCIYPFGGSHLQPLTNGYLITISESHLKFKYFLQVQLYVVYIAKLGTEVKSALPFVGTLPLSRRYHQQYLLADRDYFSTI